MPKFEPIPIEIQSIETLINLVQEIAIDAVPDVGAELGWDWNAERLDGATTGWDVSEATVTEEVEGRRDASKEVLQGLNERLFDEDDELDVNGWETAVAEELIQLLLSVYPLGKGGRSRVRNADISQLKARLNNQFGFLRRFTEQANAGELSEEQIEPRLISYADDAYYGFLEGKRASYQDEGYTLVRNVHEGSDQPCPDCQFAIAQGLVPIEEMTIPGRRICLSNCHCQLEYVQVGANGAVENSVVPRWGYVGGRWGIESVIKGVISESRR